MIKLWNTDDYLSGEYGGVAIPYPLWSITSKQCVCRMYTFHISSVVLGSGTCRYKIGNGCLGIRYFDLKV